MHESPQPVSSALIVLLTAGFAVTAAYVVTQRIVPFYEAGGTCIIGPSLDLESPETIVRAFDSLQGQGIVPTLVKLLSSQAITVHVSRPIGLGLAQK